MNITTRNADLGSLLTLLKEQHTRKIDVVAPAAAVRAQDGALLLRGTEAVLTEDGVTTADGLYTPTAVANEGIADKLGVPVAYLKRLHADRPDLYDANVNGWLHGRRPKVTAAGETVRPAVPGDARSFLVRCFRGDDTGTGIARAFLSDRYSVVDNLDVLMAALDGIRDAGVEVNIDGGDLTERRMVVRVTCPEVSAMAPALLAGYRSPFTGEYGADNPTVWAGFQISNSEVGGGAFTITPRLVVEVCRNGMTMTRDALQKVHLGGRLDAGVVRWADDTQAAAVSLVKKQTRDAVRSFLSPEYVTHAVEALTAKADEPVTNHDDARVLAKSLRYTDADVDGILAHFTRGGQMTRGGVVAAITSYAQEVTDGDTAYDLEARATSLLV
ncbi:hypothetical protein Pam4_52 [Pseudanabaena phage Pam4]|nr:hypothetical protein Pam4_52 [Pseudanabaena phage Pam4]